MIQEALGDTSEQYSPRADLIHQLLLGRSGSKLLSEREWSSEDREWAEKVIALRQVGCKSGLIDMAEKAKAEVSNLSPSSEGMRVLIEEVDNFLGKFIN